VYPKIFREARTIMFDFMAKPTEVLLTIDEDGEVEEEHIEDSENIFLYDRMRETLIYMTHIDTNAMNQLI
jgi:exportin-1